MSKMFQVVIDEVVHERRTVNVKAETPEDAAERAYYCWIVMGECDSGPEIEIPERTYMIDGESYDVEADG